MTRPSLQQLVYLVALADHGHFGRAAEACFVSQPALSSQIRELERRLGVTLVERLPRGIRLTPAGSAAVARARRVLAEVDDLVEEAGVGDDDISGTLAVGAIPTVAPYVLGGMVPILTSRFPRAQLHLDELRTVELVAGLRGGTVDLALCALPVDDDGLTVAPLFDDPLLLALPAGHGLAAARGPVDLDELVHHRVLLLEEGHCLRDQAAAVCERIGAPIAEVRASSMPTLVQMVAAGVGVTLLPASAAGVEARPGNGVVVRPFRDPPERTVVMAWRATSPRSGAFAELARLVRPRFSGLGR